MRVNTQSRRLVWKDPEIEIELQYIWNIREQELGVDITMSPQMYLSSRTSQPFDWWFTQWLVPLSRLIQVMSGEPFRAKRVGLWRKKGISRVERTAERIDVWQRGTDPAAVVDLRASERLQVPPLITGQELACLPLPQVLRNGRRDDDRHEVFHGLMASAMVLRDRPLRNRYLDAVTAIEAHDFTEHGEGPVDRAAFKERRTTAMSAVADPAAKRFLKSHLPTRSAFRLDERLNRTRTSLHLDWEQNAATMARLRNEIAHGKQPDIGNLGACFRQALHAARLLALKDVGAYPIADPSSGR